MKLEESYDKRTCDECGEYDYVWELKLKHEDECGEYEYTDVKLCKKCLMRLLKLIIER